MSDLPAPLTPADSDLRDFPHTPLFRARLFGSSFHARATDAEWRAGVTLWLKSWDQVPAGSLPEDDIELCRLAELGRDAKAWKKHKAGALRGWVLCADGRLYHPVVAEGVNNAIEAKLKQRLKTAKARIAALEKHLKTATTEEDKARITEEIRKLQQSLSLGLSQTLQQPPREGEERGKEKGLDSSEAKASGGKPPKSAADEEKAELWKALKASLVEQGTSADIKAAGVLLGKAAKDYGELVFLEACRETLREERVNTHTFLIGLCERAVGRRTGAQPKSFAQQDREEGMRRWEEMTGQVHPDRNPKSDNVIDIFPVAIGAAQ